jgi:uncharacterized pyridoxamine 5'-phosphate oxidase family protein
MLNEKCIRFAAENPVSSLATVSDGEPRVRNLGLWYADETGFYFQTGSGKEMIRNISASPIVEVCFFRASGMLGESMRVRGVAEFIDDMTMKEKVLNDRPFLKTFGLKADSPELVIFRIPHGTVKFWSIRSEFMPSDLIHF